MTASQKALETKERPFVRARKTGHILWTVAMLSIVWIELWIPVTVVAGMALTGDSATPPIWIVILFFALGGHTRVRKEFANNVAGTYRHLLLLLSRLESLDNWQFPKVEGVELGSIVTGRHLLYLIRKHKHRAVPFDRMMLWVRPANSQGNEKWPEAYGDFMKRKFRFGAVDHEENPDDENEYVFTLSSDRLPDRVDAVPPPEFEVVA